MDVSLIMVALPHDAFGRWWQPPSGQLLHPGYWLQYIVHNVALDLVPSAAVLLCRRRWSMMALGPPYHTMCSSNWRVQAGLAHGLGAPDRWFVSARPDCALVHAQGPVRCHTVWYEFFSQRLLRSLAPFHIGRGSVVTLG
jgi:hypothetical protein